MCAVTFFQDASPHPPQKCHRHTCLFVAVGNVRLAGFFAVHRTVTEKLLHNSLVAQNIPVVRLTVWMYLLTCSVMSASCLMHLLPLSCSAYIISHTSNLVISRLVILVLCTYLHILVEEWMSNVIHLFIHSKLTGNRLESGLPVVFHKTIRNGHALHKIATEHGLKRCV